ncbi:dynamin family protein [Pacificoceanicola onchidii]|uniref:dynamin family protein n=1 Tax=Pacificoceanicola onchidii TaxID=2562685 RepID=UPI0010A3F4B6|nr:dynamin family protein [Pacificoceanicola onchidii]
MTATPTTRRPRIALMGEFSAGKSTLANLLLGQRVSPVKVTATQLPPVWYSFGHESILRVDNSGQTSAIAASALNGISHHDTQAVRVLLEAEVLEFCDVIDMPGTSDPNMPSEVWQRVLDRADGVVWCTPATQAWRQSEAALWEQLPARLHENSLLLITRMDALKSQTDRDRVTARVRRETEGLFRHALPISLTDALSDPDNPDVLEQSGADRFVENLVELVEALGTPQADGGAARFEAIGKPEPAPAPVAPAPPPVDGVVPRRVIPKRVRRAPVSARP